MDLILNKVFKIVALNNMLAIKMQAHLSEAGAALAGRCERDARAAPRRPTCDRCAFRARAAVPRAAFLSPAPSLDERTCTLPTLHYLNL